MEVIEPVTLSEDAAVNENVVDTTVVYDWRFRNQQWNAEMWPGSSKQGPLMKTTFLLRLHLLQCACFSPLHSSTIWQWGIGRERCILNGSSDGNPLCEHSHVDPKMDWKSTYALVSEKVLAGTTIRGIEVASAYWWSLWTGWFGNIFWCSNSSTPPRSQSKGVCQHPRGRRPIGLQSWRCRVVSVDSW